MDDNVFDKTSNNKHNEIQYNKIINSPEPEKIINGENFAKMDCYLFKASDQLHLFKILVPIIKIENGIQKHGYKGIQFGHFGYFTYLTLHRDNFGEIRESKIYRAKYINNHKNEEWGIKGIYTRGFWARWLLWNKKTINKSINDLKKKYNINIIC